MVQNPFDSPVILLTRLDLTPDGEEPGLAWLDAHFIPTTMRSLDATSAMRLRCLEGEPDHVVVYGCGSKPLGASAQPMPRTPDMLDRWMRNYDNRWHRASSRSGGMGQSALMNLITTRVYPGAARAFDDWYSGVHVPEILACPGWLNSRRFAGLDDDGTFLAAYELSDPVTPFDSDPFRSAVGWDGQAEQLIGYHGFRIYEVVQAL